MSLLRLQWAPHYQIASQTPSQESFIREGASPPTPLPATLLRTHTHARAAGSDIPKDLLGLERQEPVGKLRDVLRKSKSQIATVSCWQL